MTIASLYNVNKKYKNKDALVNISLSIAKSSATVICGPSGSGKSTLLRVIAGLESFQDGQITVLGKRYTPEKHGIFDGSVGMLFQQFNLFERLTVLENLSLAPITRLKIPKQKAINESMSILERIGLREHSHKLPQQLSGGEQQRAALARAILNKPQLLLFDEPTSSLDPELIHDVLCLIKEMVIDEGITAIIVTHEMGFARAIADTIIFMDRGMIIENTSPENFFVKPQSSRAQLFLSRVLHHA